jgi:hypothetical protein
MSTIRDLFQRNVTRNIPPVVYFHEQTPEQLATEVGEYIVTGGYAPGDPRTVRVSRGIHEELVSLLRAIVSEMVPGGASLPASWISGFYGSGKSSFAKLLGLAIGGAVLPDGTPLWKALVRRDDSPRAQELVDAFDAFQQKFPKSLAVVFDIGSFARDGQNVHHAIVRKVQERLGYCRRDPTVAEFELKLERDGLYETFCQVAEKTLGKPWDVAKLDALADDHFSEVMHAMQPARYSDPLAWFKVHAASRQSSGASPVDAVDAIEQMLDARAPDSALFIVVDEVSQFVAQDDEKRMLRLQTFVENLGARLKGKAWLLATGQQKLEAESVANTIGKLKDRFPPKLRVHLANTNIRDVVHKRLLRKKPEQEADLRTRFQTHRADLKVYAYGCESITEEDFVEVYPMLPGHVDLLLEITSQIRVQSTRVQGDDYAIRGLLQLLGELFRSQKLADREVGVLVTLDMIFEVQHTALHPDVQNTLRNIFEHPEVLEDPLCARVAKAVALLQLVQNERLPTSADLVAKCLYARLGQGSNVAAVTQALDRLHALGLLSRLEKTGYRIQSSAGQEWAKEREDTAATPQARSLVIQQELEQLVGEVKRPEHRGSPFPWLALFNDGGDAVDVRLKDPRIDAAITVDYRLVARREDREATSWAEKSDQALLRDRILWIGGDPSALFDLAKSAVQSARMVRNNEGRLSALSSDAQHFFFDEQRRLEDSLRKLRAAIADALLSGTLYFRGTSWRARDLGSTFDAVLLAAANQALPILFPHFTALAISDRELEQLFQLQLAGPSAKFMDGEGGLGILVQDAGKYVARCEGAIPSRIGQHVIETNGVSGAMLLQHFGKPPYGYAADVVRACVLGLLRGRKVRIEPEQGKTVGAYSDEGARDLFIRLGDFRRATILPPSDTKLDQRAWNKLARFFRESLQLDVEPDPEPITDAVFRAFGGVRERLRRIESQLQRLPGRPEPVEPLRKLERALEACRRSRQVDDTGEALVKHLDALRDGVQQLGIHEAELTDAAIEAIARAASVRDAQLAQLRHLGDLGAVVEEAAQRLDAHLASERPWRELAALAEAAEIVRARYRELRSAIVLQHTTTAELHRASVKMRDGFSKLTPDQASHVLRPIAEAAPAGIVDAVVPTLIELRDGTPVRLAQALDQAVERLDTLVVERPQPEGGPKRKPIVRLEARLAGREVATADELERVLGELRERVLEQLQHGVRVRLQ